MGQEDTISKEEAEKAFDELIWELQSITRMTKNQVLNQIYPEEIEIILDREEQRRKKEEFERLQGYLNQFMVNSTGKAVKKYRNNLIERIEELSNDDKEEKTDKKIENEEDLNEELSKLSKLKRKAEGR